MISKMALITQLRADNACSVALLVQALEEGFLKYGTHFTNRIIKIVNNLKTWPNFVRGYPKQDNISITLQVYADPS